MCVGRCGPLVSSAAGRPDTRPREDIPADPAALGCPPEALTPEGWLRILPSQWAEKGGLDGFFAAKLERIAD